MHRRTTLTWQSRRIRPDDRKAIGEYSSFTRRGVEDAAPYKACSVGDCATKFMACMALTERRYRRNRCILF